MITDNNRIWIETAYDAFAQQGPNGLKIESIARVIGKSKSSFYHHFADLELFTDVLLGYHLDRAKNIALRMQRCDRMDPDMLELLVDVKTDILFHRQLRIHRNVQIFRQCFEKAHAPIEEALLGVWSKALDLGGRERLARIMLNLAVENFYLRVTAESLSREWLLHYISEIRAMVAAMSSEG